MPKIYNESPFYERDNILKNYFKLLAIPGRYAQASEFSEIQSILLSCIKSIGDSLFANGNVQSGCNIITYDDHVVITPGKIYLDGVVRNTVECTVPITAQGTEIITARLEETLISENDDTTLLDPATTSSSAYQPGCFRVKQDIVFEVNGEGYPVATLVDGVLQNFIVEKPQMDLIEEVLARRTFAESGNYVVNGLDMKLLEYETEEGLLVGLSKGQAFVKGYEINKPIDTTFLVDKALVTRDVYGEPKTFNRNNTSYSLINTPVNDVTRVFVTLTTSQTFAYNDLVADYSLSSTPVVAIISVSSGTTTYTNNVDYTLVNNKLQWLGNKAPTNGTNFSVSYTYKSNLVEGTDYQLSEDLSTVSIINASLLSDSEILIDYSYFLARRDTVCIDTEGMPVIVKGTDDTIHKCIAPKINDPQYLTIGEILVYPNSNKYELFNSTVRVSTMQRIQSAIHRLDKLEYNTMMTNLDKELLTKENTEQLRGLFTEAFVTFDKVDFTMEDTHVSFDFDLGMLVPPSESTNHNLSLENNANNKYGIIGDVYTLPYSTKVELEQNIGSQAMLINPYQVFDPIMVVEITPAVDAWIEEELITITTTTNIVVDSWSSRIQSTSVSSSKQVTTNVINTWWEDSSSNSDSSFSNQNASNSAINGLKNNSIIPKNSASTSGNTSVVESSIQYMRKNTIKVTSTTFPITATNVRCTFDGRPVNLTPLNSTLRGDTAGSVKPDANCLIEASFEIPSEVPCGTVEVRLYDNNLQGSTPYTAMGRKRTVTEQIFKTKKTYVNYDPLAETFSVNQTSIVTGIDLYFADKDSESVTVQIRNVVAGYPGNIIYGEVSKNADELLVSDKGTVATHFEFPNIVQCERGEEYCIVILTTSAKASVFVSQLGAKDLITGDYIIANPFTNGVLLSSSNASTWTAHQDMDLKFKLYVAQFESTGELNFNSIAMNRADRLLYAIDAVRSVSTEYVIYSKINNFNETIINEWQSYGVEEHVTSCKVRIALSTSDPYQSPCINKDSSQVVSFVSDASATYISKNITLNSKCQEIKVIFNTSSEPEVSTKVYLATDGIGATWQELTDPVSYPIDSYSKQLEYFIDGLDYANYRIKIVTNTTNTCIKPFVSKLGVICNESI